MEKLLKFMVFCTIIVIAEMGCDMINDLKEQKQDGSREEVQICTSQRLDFSTESAVSLKLGMQTAIYIPNFRDAGIPNFRDTPPLSAAVPLRQNSVRGILYGRVSNPPLQKQKTIFFINILSTI